MSDSLYAASRSARGMVHKATPRDAQPGASTCFHCDADVRAVPGGRGLTWVHSATGTVAASGEPRVARKAKNIAPAVGRAVSGLRQSLPAIIRVKRPFDRPDMALVMVFGRDNAEAVRKRLEDLGYTLPDGIQQLDGSDYALRIPVGPKDWIVSAVDEIDAETEQAYMRPQYTDAQWRTLIATLLDNLSVITEFIEDGLSRSDIAWLLNSKHLRWAIDQQNGSRVTGAQLVAYLCDDVNYVQSDLAHLAAGEIR